MKFNLKMIAVAAAMVSAGAASAAPITDGQDGSLLIGAFNTVTQAWYLRDTGYTINTFLPSSVTTLSGDGTVTGNKTPTAGLTLNSSNTASFADASFSGWLTGQTVANVRWFVSAADSSGGSATNSKRFITSSAASGQTASNGQIDNFANPESGAASLGTFWELGTNGENVSTGTDAAPGFLDLFGVGPEGLASLGNSAGLYYFARSTPTNFQSTAAIGTQFGNGAGYATVSLANNGDFTYTLAPETVPPSAVPVPAAAWLLGSGLLSFGAFVRRRTAK